MEIDITGLDPAKLLAALYNHARVQGLGVFLAKTEPMTPAQAQAELDAMPEGRFDYLHGRVMKIDVRKNPMYCSLYDRDNGQGAAQRIVNSLRESEQAA